MTNVSRLRASARAAKLPAEDRAALEYALLLADLLDRAAPLTLRQVADGERGLSLEDRLAIVSKVGPQYQRALTSLGLTRAGRGVMPASAIPTTGSPSGASAEQATHDRHRARFSERAGG